MCGITGKIYFNESEISLDNIKRMNEAVNHRGPDDVGIYISPDKKVGLGHRRLAVIDLSPFGHQPMRYMDRYQIVFNGEIYNFQEKRNFLESNGYKFKSKSDTEVVLALYSKFGKECLQHLRGMFSFAIYDEQEKTLFCARDRVGKKPFKYYLDNDVFIFASELKSIITQSEYKKELDYVAVDRYLTLQYCPSPFTGFKNLKKLEAAHYLFIDLKTKTIEKKQYWKLDYSHKLNISKKEWGRRILEKLEECVKIRMNSDVPLGAFLSGGIDSSAIVALMSKNNSQKIRTFSIGFEEQEHSELNFAKIISNKFKTNHQEFILKPNIKDALLFIAKQYEEPFADNSAIATYQLSRTAKGEVTVALTGDGGDENFGGYRRYSYHKIALALDHFTVSKKVLTHSTVINFLSNSKNTFLHNLCLFLANLNTEYAARYTHYMYRFPSKLKDDLYTDDFKNFLNKEGGENIIIKQFKDANLSDKMDQAFYVDFLTYLPDDLMVKVDIASMAVGLETRSPFLDHELLELTAKIPAKYKISGFFNKKHILKKALEGILPKEILYRPKKGFDIPIKSWLQSEELQTFVRKKLTSQQFLSRGIFKKEVIEKMLSQHADGHDLSVPIMNILMLELWLEQYFN